MPDIAHLTRQLQLEFSDTALLEEALSHRSLGSRNYERLEFLGDSCLNFVIATCLYHKRADEDEGALSRLRASLVRQSTLADIAREMDLGSFVRMGPGELRASGFRRDSVLSDVVESIIGAVLIDAGFDAARELVLRLYADRIDRLPASAELKDPKTRLQELLQGRSHERPDYAVIETRGKSHERRFTVACSLPELSLTVRATATSRRKAEQAAATLMLEKVYQQLSEQSG